MKEPDVPEKYKVKGMSEDFRRLRMTINIEVEADAAKRLHSVLTIVERSKILPKYFGNLTKILSMGPFGPKIDDHDAQCDRAQDSKVNIMFHCFSTGVELKGLSNPNQKFYTKRTDDTYWSEGTGSRKSTINANFE